MQTPEMKKTFKYNAMDKATGKVLDIFLVFCFRCLFFDRM